MDDMVEPSSQKLNRISWVTVRSVLSIPAVRWVGLFPFVGYVILYNEKIIDVLQTRYPNLNIKGLDYFNLNCTFFGLLFLGIASFIYQIFSPNEVRTYSNVTEFITQALRTVTPLALNLYVEEIIPLLKNDTTKDFARKNLREAGRIELTSPGTFEESVNMKWSAWIEECMYPIADILVMYYNVRANKRFRPACYICLFTAILGYSVMLIPTFRITVAIVGPLLTTAYAA